MITSRVCYAAMVMAEGLGPQSGSNQPGSHGRAVAFSPTTPCWNEQFMTTGLPKRWDCRQIVVPQQWHPSNARNDIRGEQWRDATCSSQRLTQLPLTTSGLVDHDQSDSSICQHLVVATTMLMAAYLVVALTVIPYQRRKTFAAIKLHDIRVHGDDNATLKRNRAHRREPANEIRICADLLSHFPVNPRPDSNCVLMAISRRLPIASSSRRR